MKNIVISSGHGGRDKGACYRGFLKTIYEKDIAFRLTNIVVGMLRDFELNIYHNQETGLKQKVIKVNQVVNKLPPDSTLAFEIHLNSSASKKVKGCETLYYQKTTNENRRIARVINTAMFDHIAGIAIRNRGVKPGYFQGDPEKGMLYFLRFTQCPAFIIEPLFLNQAYKCSQADLRLVAEGIALGIYAGALA